MIDNKLCTPRPNIINNAFAKLSHKQVIELKERLQDSKSTYQDLAQEYQVSKTTIWRIATNRSWVQNEINLKVNQAIQSSL